MAMLHDEVTPPMKKIWIRSKMDVPEVCEADKALREDFAKKGVEVVDQFVPGLDLCICISGDGTLLATLMDIGEERFKTPILSIHGSYGLGFLHTLSLPQEGEDIQKWSQGVSSFLLKGDYSLQDRWGLVGEISNPATNAIRLMMISSELPFLYRLDRQRQEYNGHERKTRDAQPGNGACQ